MKKNIRLILLNNVWRWLLRSLELFMELCHKQEAPKGRNKKHLILV